MQRLTQQVSQAEESLQMLEQQLQSSTSLLSEADRGHRTAESEREFAVQELSAVRAELQELTRQKAEMQLKIAQGKTAIEAEYMQIDRMHMVMQAQAQIRDHEAALQRVRTVLAQALQGKVAPVCLV